MEEEDEIQPQACKLPRLANGRTDPTTSNNANNKIAGSSRDGSSSRLHGWHHSSRIIRVSRASGGKDRHSKVMTSKGLRDRRVRLSVTTAIQFYDLQDRLGYDQPSKAVEWLIKSAQDAIAELPSLNNTFPDDTPNHNSPDAPIDNQNQNQNQNLSLSKSACSSTSETSKGSGLSLSRTDIRVKARERARERAAKEKKKENNNSNNENSVVHEHQQHQSINPVSPSFTELLTGGITTTTTTTTANSPTSDEPHATLFHKAAAAAAARQQWASPPMDYFTQVLAAPSSSSSSRTHQHQIQLGHHNLAEPISFNNNNDHHNHHLQQQHYSFIPDQFMPSHSHNHHHQSDYNLNFTISPASASSGLAAYNNNRGTLQSNSPSHFLPHLQRFSLPMDGSTVPFFIGAASAAPPPPMDNHHHQFSSPAFDARLHLYYADGTRHPDHKGKSKN